MFDQIFAGCFEGKASDGRELVQGGHSQVPLALVFPLALDFGKRAT
jgi:hypothetical protein